MIKTFKGIVADETQDKIHITGVESGKGFRIVKLEMIPQNVSTTTNEIILKIYKASQTTTTAVIDFSDDALLGVGFWTNNADTHLQPWNYVTIFDKEVINQDLYLTMVNVTSSDPVNYYIELEEVKMSDAEAANVNFVAALLHT